GLGDVARKKKQVVIGQRACKSENGSLIRRRHIAQFQVADLATDRSRIIPCIDVRHIERSPNQASSFGHRRLMALPPATTLTCPPLRTTSCLSVDPAHSTRGLAAS